MPGPGEGVPGPGRGMPGPGGEGSKPGGGLLGADPPSRTNNAADGSYWNAFLFKLFYC